MTFPQGFARGLTLLGLVAFAAGAGGASKDKSGAKDRAILSKLEEPIELKFKDAPLEDVLKFIKSATVGPDDSGLAIYVDPVGLQEAEKTMRSPVTIDAKGEPLGSSLERLLKPLGLVYQVKDGLLTVTSEVSEDVEIAAPGGPKAGAPK